MAKCYNGGLEQIRDKFDKQYGEGAFDAGVWKWAKANGIDKGFPLEKVSDLINQRFFGGQAKPGWIADILSARKTPFKMQADAVWKAQYNRRMITQQAASLAKAYGMNPVARAARMVWEIPRFAATLGHGVVFPITHGGDLLFRPENWSEFSRGWLNAWKATMSEATAGRIVADMESRPWYDLSLRSKLDVAHNSRPDDVLTSALLTAKNPAFRGFLETARKYGVEPSERAWNALKVMRYEIWEKQMKKYATPDMSHEQLLELGTQLADWANHATGSAKFRIPGMRESLRFSSDVLFGPKITGSKLARIFADPVKTAVTFGKMATGQEVTAGERAAAYTRLSGSAQYAGTLAGFLAVGWGVNKALGVPDDKNINLLDPTKSDFLAFKVGGLVGYPPGLHTEIKTLGNILATALMNDKDFKERYKYRGASKEGRIQETLMKYGTAKLSPAAQAVREGLTGTDVFGRPMPWSSKPGGKGFFAKEDWRQYAISKLPIPLTGPIGYVYDQFKQNGMSASQASTYIKALITGAIGATGFHVHAEGG